MYRQVENENQLFFTLLLVTTFCIVSTSKPMIYGSESPFLHSCLREFPFLKGDFLDNLVALYTSLLWFDAHDLLTFFLMLESSIHGSQDLFTLKEYLATLFYSAGLTIVSSIGLASTAIATEYGSSMVVDTGSTGVPICAEKANKSDSNTCR